MIHECPDSLKTAVSSRLVCAVVCTSGPDEKSLRDIASGKIVMPGTLLDESVD